MSELPPVRKKPCRQCPWRRKSAPGFLGPLAAEDWADLIRSDEPVACHDTIDPEEVDLDGEADWGQPGLKQCAGAARTRANMCKIPRDPNVAVGPRDEACFDHVHGFLEYHEGGKASSEEVAD